MDKESGGVLRGKVSCFGKDLFELFVGKHSRLFEAVHGLVDFHINILVRGNGVVKVILVDDLLRDVR